MRFLLGWAVKLGFLAVAYLVLTGTVRIQLPEKLLGYEVPQQAREWVDRNSQITDIGAKTQAGFKTMADGIK
ncbi:MAG: hypothetical protein ISP49_17410 [Reyranella sp.]|nr:hypothetical protein [Reyranella sp.]MBL6653379.1 hypothetical protein [Reyranella sp.]